MINIEKYKTDIRDLAMIKKDIVNEVEATGNPDTVISGLDRLERDTMSLIETIIEEANKHIFISENTEKKNPSNVGIIPRYLWVERRFNDVRGCIMRYAENLEEIPLEWVEEYGSLRKEILERNTSKMT